MKQQVFSGKRLLAVLCAACLVLTVAYYNNAFDPANDAMFADFQADSQALAGASLVAGVLDVPQSAYGLGQVFGVKGSNKESWSAYLAGGSTYLETQLEDENFANQLCITQPIIAFVRNTYTESYAVSGGAVRTQGDKVYSITDVKENGRFYYVSVKASAPLTVEENGPVHTYAFLDADGNAVPPVTVMPYISQVGLQGKAYYALGNLLRWPSYRLVQLLQLVCSMALALVAVGIVYGVYRKYNLCMAACWFVTFWLSPWIVSFARNLYWVEFTWFLPMLLGLFCTLQPQRRKIFYALAFFAVALKCLCGYEYISAILVGLVLFPCADFLCAAQGSQRAKAFWQVFWLGVWGTLGFLCAGLLHAAVRGDGSVVQGLIAIYQQDIQRTTWAGGDPSTYSAVFASSNSASVGDVLWMFSRFQTQILTGIDGNLFPVLVLGSAALVGAGCVKAKRFTPSAALYALGLFAALSWFVLAKVHSHAHPHLNFVLWYFGFVQMMLYAIVTAFLQWTAPYRNREKQT